MKSKSIASAIGRLLDDFFLVQKDIDRITDMYDVVVKEVEIAMIKKLMKLTHRNKTKVAQILGLSRTTLNKKLQNLGLNEHETA